MSLVLLGDLSYPYKDSVDIDDIYYLFQEKISVANLEGPILNLDAKVKTYDSHKYNLYSSPDVLEVLKRLNIKSVNLANNHIYDFKNEIKNTTEILEESGIDYFGLKTKKWSIIESDAIQYAFYGAYTFTTGGNRPKSCLLNTLKPKHALEEIRIFKELHPNAIVVVFIHWGYELADYPQPADRTWARKAIEAGASAVVGHHPHVVQGIEMYKGGIIAYSLGNFIMPQVKYLDKKMHYKSEKVLNELLLEINATNNISYCPYFIYYDLKSNKIKPYEIDAESEIKKMTSFEGSSNEEYLKWFAANIPSGRYPVYKNYDNFFKVIFNNIYIKSLKTLRKGLIMLGIHKPFKQLD